MNITPLTRNQWISVVKNAIIAGVAAFGVALQASGEVSRTAVYSAIVAGAAAVIKIVEKAFSEV